MVSVSACTVTKLVYVTPDIPQELLSCKDEPSVPAEGATKGQWGQWAGDERDFGRDCKSKNEGIAKWQVKQKSLHTSQ